MNILFLLSCLEPAGSETYCLSLARRWTGRHQIHWISDRLHFGQDYTAWPISAKIFPQGILNVARVARYARRHRIDLIHSHSRRAHWVAAHAAAPAGAAHVATLHQPQKVHFFSRLEPCLGQATIAISEAVQRHLEKHFSHGIRKLHLIRNGLEISRTDVPENSLPPLEKGGKGGFPDAANPRILIVGRLSGGRWKALEFFFQVLQKIGARLPPAAFEVIGHIPPERRPLLQARLQEINVSIAPSRIEARGFVDNLPEAYAAATGVVAGGRSGLEALAAGRPVVFLGEKGVLGLAGPESWPRILETNGGDHLEQEEFVPARLEQGLHEMLSGAAVRPAWGLEQVKSYYDVGRIASRIEAVYREVLSRKK